jgi:hypothetical protein
MVNWITVIECEWRARYRGRTWSCQLVLADELL